MCLLVKFFKLAKVQKNPGAKWAPVRPTLCLEDTQVTCIKVLLVFIFRLNIFLMASLSWTSVQKMEVQVVHRCIIYALMI